MKLDSLIILKPYMRHLSHLNTSANTAALIILDASFVICIVLIFYLMMAYAKYGNIFRNHGKKTSLFSHWNAIAALAGIICTIILMLISGANRITLPENAVPHYESEIKDMRYLKKIYPRLKPGQHIKYIGLSHSLAKDADDQEPHTRKIPGKIQAIHAYRHLKLEIRANDPAKLKKPAWYRYL